MKAIAFFVPAVVAACAAGFYIGAWTFLDEAGRRTFCGWAALGFLYLTAILCGRGIASLVL